MKPGPSAPYDEPNGYGASQDHISSPIYPSPDDEAPLTRTASNDSDAHAIIDSDSDAPDAPLPPPNVQLHDIKTEFHPTSGRPTKIVAFEDYAHDNLPDTIPQDKCPWAPFESRLDFEIAELSLEAALNHSQLNKLINLVHSAAKKDPDNSFNIKSAGDMKKKWEEASHLRTPVSTNNYLRYRR